MHQPIYTLGGETIAGLKIIANHQVEPPKVATLGFRARVIASYIFTSTVFSCLLSTVVRAIERQNHKQKVAGSNPMLGIVIFAFRKLDFLVSVDTYSVKDISGCCSSLYVLQPWCKFRVYIRNMPTGQDIQQ